MRNNEGNLKRLVSELEISEGAYKRAIRRYEVLGEWFGTEGRACEPHEPLVRSQGSFRLGTAIKPLGDKDGYDLDLTCTLRKGINAATHSQKALKNLVAEDLEAYRQANTIKKEIELKHRCLCLEYSDGINFHMDIVPAIPADAGLGAQLIVAMESNGFGISEATSIASEAVAITDDQLETFPIKGSNWSISNPEGYAQWFESCMSKNAFQDGLQPTFEARAEVEDVPIYLRKTPLQQVIMLLKRHRDKMFKDSSDSKPISVIITTLVSQGYQGSTSLTETLRVALETLGEFVRLGEATVPNPVNPDENFADKWTKPKYLPLRLQENFGIWVQALASDFKIILESNKAEIIAEVFDRGFEVSESDADLAQRLGLAAASLAAAPSSIAKPASKPWCL